MRKMLYKIKFLISSILSLSIIFPNYASLSASDGLAFITRAEYENGFKEFDSRLNTFEAGVNSKIDSQVTSYLDRNGIWSGLKQDLQINWSMPDYNWNATGLIPGAQVHRDVPIGQGCCWGDIFGLPRDSEKWHLKWKDTTPHTQLQLGFTSWTDWDTFYPTNFNTTNGYNSVLFAGGDLTEANMKAQIQWSPTLYEKLKNPEDYPNKKIESINWTVIPSITKSGLLFLDFGQTAEYDPYLYINTRWDETGVKWDAGYKYNFSIVFRRYNKDGVFVEDPWEEPWGGVEQTKIQATKLMKVSNELKRIGSDGEPYSVSGSQISITRFRKSICFFVSKGDKIDAIVKTVGYNEARSYLGRYNWAWNSQAKCEKMAVHGPVFTFYGATVY